jgi:hypothetical protein
MHQPFKNTFDLRIVGVSLIQRNSMDQSSSLIFDEKELNPLSSLLSKIVIFKFITF